MRVGIREQRAVRFRGKASQRLRATPDLHHPLAAPGRLVGLGRTPIPDVHAVDDGKGPRGRRSDILQFVRDVVDFEAFGEEDHRLAAVHGPEPLDDVRQRREESAGFGICARHDQARVLLHLPARGGRVFGCALAPDVEGRNVGGQPLLGVAVHDPAEHRLVAARDFVGLISPHRSDGTDVGLRARTDHRAQGLSDLRHVARELHLRTGAGQRVERHAVAGMHGGPKETIDGLPGALLVPGPYVGLVEDDGVDLSARRALVGGDLRRDGAPGGLGVGAGGLLNVLEQQDRPQLPALPHLEFVRADVRERPSVRARDPNVEANDIHTGPENRGLLAGRRCLPPGVVQRGGGGGEEQAAGAEGTQAIHGGIVRF